MIAGVVMLGWIAVNGQFALPPQAKTPATAAVAAQDFYAACMDMSTIARRSTEPLGPVLQAIARMQNTRQLAGPVADLHRVGVAALFGASGLTAPADNAQNRTHLTALFQLLGDTASVAAQEARTALELGISLEQARRGQQGPRPNLTRGELAKLVPAFDWNAFFEDLGPNAETTLSANPGYLQALNGRLLTVPLADWQSYLRWRWLEVGAPLLPSAFSQAAAALEAVTPPGSRDAACHAAVHRYTPSQLLAAGILRDDYFGDTMRLRMRLRSRLADRAPRALQ